MMSSKVAVVTGSNKGIGYAIVKGLCEATDWIVYMTARNVVLGREACEKLRSELKASDADKLRIHQLDITNADSIGQLKSHLLDTYGGLDVLINNAGMAFSNASTTPDDVQAEKTLETNYFGTRALTDALLPILRKNGRIVVVASQMGLLRKVPDDALKQRLQLPDLTLEQLDQIMKDYIMATKLGKRKEQGFPTNSYCMSKVGEIAMTRIYQRMLDNADRSDVIIDACCPGYVDTDMTDHKGTRTIEEGAKTPIFIAVQDAARLPRGKMMFDCNEINWDSGRPETSV